MIQRPTCTFTTLFDMLCGDTEVTITRLNDGKELYKGKVMEALIGLRSASVDYPGLVVAYNGVYNNRTTGNLDIEVWDLTILEDPDL